MKGSKDLGSPALGMRRTALRLTVKALFGILGSVRVSGLENIPLGTAYVAAVNHVSIYDPPFLLSFWPETLAAIGAVDVFDKPVQGELLSIYGTTPVHRGQVDRSLIDNMLQTLRSGQALMIAPEGGRSHRPAMRRAKPGIAHVVDAAEVPVVPVGIMGTTDDFLRRSLQLKRPPIEMRVGKPFRLPPLEGRGAAKRESRQRNADMVMQHIARLLPPEYGGVYADSAFSPA
jgi:1-acyl-sn-glycerol-3-phosphate acyltransferase